ncbi:hypothetical protein OROGR_017383 [Orobanche gracilis]
MPPSVIGGCRRLLLHNRLIKVFPRSHTTILHSPLLPTAVKTACNQNLTPSGAASVSSPVAVPGTVKEEEITNFPGRKSSPAFVEAGLRAISRGGLPSQPTSNILASAGNTISNNEALGTMYLTSEMRKISTLGYDDRSSGMVGEIAIVTCKPEYAYGSAGFPPDISPEY